MIRHGCYKKFYLWFI